MLENHPILDTANGSFVDINNERFYCIENVDSLPPFFISVISQSDHWLFISSNGGLSAGRVSPETALFPYECVDKITDDYLNTGSRTVLRVKSDNGDIKWEPFNQEHDGLFKIQRNLYKSTLGNKVCFEEINFDLSIRYRYFWETSEEFGFIRRCELVNEGDNRLVCDILDGVQNILPAGTPKFTQTVSSNLVDAYKCNERDPDSSLGLYSLYSAITDRAEPCEALHANTVFSLGIENKAILLSSSQLKAFKRGDDVTPELTQRGVRGAYLVASTLEVEASESRSWLFAINIEQSQTQISQLQGALKDIESLESAISESVETGNNKLAAIVAASDGFQATDEEEVCVHHYANTLFNVLRGGIYSDQYNISIEDFRKSLAHFNQAVYKRHKDKLTSLPGALSFEELGQQVTALNDPQLLRLYNEYLPIYFGRRHGDPSRPWNQFSIKLKDEQNQPLLTYQGNWRDIFQNWEALSYSYPEFIENIIAKFVNASTVDGYNPYRITKEGIDWEVEDPEDPWSYIGYWGDHQIIYLLKLLELSQKFHPEKLNKMLANDLFCYANVPYRLKRFDEMLKDAKNTVEYDDDLAETIEQRVNQMGADGKLILTANNEVYQVNLLEKLLVPLLAKLSNLVLDGGIWLNTQRPEWNDANNALVGQGLSMVTLNYSRRYIEFLSDLLNDFSDSVLLSAEVNVWIDKMRDVFVNLTPALKGAPVEPALRYSVLEKLGRSACQYRKEVYANGGFTGKTPSDLSVIKELLNHAMCAIEHCISVSKTDSGLYHAYNLLSVNNGRAEIRHLYPMLEGQVAALSSGKLSAQECVDITNALFESSVYREDQNTFMLYPDREKQMFLQKNVVNKEEISKIPSLSLMLSQGDGRLVNVDSAGQYHFNPFMVNKNAVLSQFNKLKEEYASLEQDQEAILALYEATFDHQSFTGRSGGMFGFEGLGCIYWHMVSKMLLALGENFTSALQKNEERSTVKQLGDLYYRVRDGIGFNKTPGEYGAFPTDPYSHTPKHAGAQQPGMTGQVKEELIARFIELGISVFEGKVSINPALLREQEFSRTGRDFWYVDVNNDWQKVMLGANQLAFTWCQVPFVYHLQDGVEGKVSMTNNLGEQVHTDNLELSASLAQDLFKRNSNIKRVDVVMNRSHLFN